MRRWLILMGLVSTARMHAYVTPTIDTDHSCHVGAMGLIRPIVWGLCRTTSRHWLLMASGADTHAYRGSRTDAILRNQARAWFKNIFEN